MLKEHKTVSHVMMKPKPASIDYILHVEREHDQHGGELHGEHVSGEHVSGEHDRDR
jgi:hypothetical protein